MLESQLTRLDAIDEKGKCLTYNIIGWTSRPMPASRNGTLHPKCQSIVSSSLIGTHFAIIKWQKHFSSLTIPLRIFLTYKCRTSQIDRTWYRHLHGEEMRLLREMSEWWWESKKNASNSSWELPILNAAYIILSHFLRTRWHDLKRMKDGQYCLHLKCSKQRCKHPLSQTQHFL